jgi:hypothetical protein
VAIDGIETTRVRILGLQDAVRGGAGSWLMLQHGADDRRQDRKGRDAECSADGRVIVLCGTARISRETARPVVGSSLSTETQPRSLTVVNLT